MKLLDSRFSQHRQKPIFKPSGKKSNDLFKDVLEKEIQKTTLRKTLS